MSDYGHWWEKNGGQARAEAREEEYRRELSQEIDREIDADFAWHAKHPYGN